MINKVLGTAIILAALFGLIFAVKYFPVHVSNSELQEHFQECIANFEQYKETNCRMDFAKIIKENGLQLDAEAITIDCEVQRACVVEAQYVQKIDFFGVWKYKKPFHPIAKGVAPKRT